MAAARLDWQVLKVPLYGAAGTRLAVVPDAHAVVRADRWGSDDCPIFGIVGDDYTPVQNVDAFRFFDPVIKSGVAAYNTAGALGRRRTGLGAGVGERRSGGRRRRRDCQVTCCSATATTAAGASN